MSGASTSSARRQPVRLPRVPPTGDGDGQAKSPPRCGVEGERFTGEAEQCRHGAATAGSVGGGQQVGGGSAGGHARILGAPGTVRAIVSPYCRAFQRVPSVIPSEVEESAPRPALRGDVLAILPSHAPAANKRAQADLEHHRSAERMQQRERERAGSGHAEPEIHHHPPCHVCGERDDRPREPRSAEHSHRESASAMCGDQAGYGWREQQHRKRKRPIGRAAPSTSRAAGMFFPQPARSSASDVYIRVQSCSRPMMSTQVSRPCGVGCLGATKSSAVATTS